ncbi:MAG: hydantoinase/oxoprolinase N-terminal domain-containing protein, partial [Roseococcus sp.]
MAPSDRPARVRLAADIGGTFTDIALEAEGVDEVVTRWTAKVLTTPEAPERGVLEGVRLALARAGLTAADV